MVIPTSVIALFAGLAGIAWLVFARSIGRSHAQVLSWLALPFFALCVIYIWFSLVNVEVDVRTVHARYGLFGISSSQAIILLLLSYWNKVR